MLGKLLKYELKSTARTFLPFYAAVLVLSILNRVLFVMLENISFLNIPRVLTMMTYVFIIIATFVMTYVVMIQRFYKNLLSEEGYLSMTLPVKTSSHILSKGISSTIWIASTLIVTLISVLIMLPNYDFIPQMIQYFAVRDTTIDQMLGMNLWLFIALLVIIGLVAIITSILMIYTAISFGQLSNKHKVLTSFGAYVGLYMVVQAVNATLIAIVSSSFMEKLLERNLMTISGGEVIETMPKNFILILFLGVLCLELVYGVAYFFITRYLLDKKLNLE